MITRLKQKLLPDPKAVILQFFNLDPVRTKRIIGMVSSLDEKEAGKILNRVFTDFSKRHRNFEEVIFSNYKKVEKYIRQSGSLDRNRRLLIGAYFSKEYSVSSAALFNPSIVPHPDQSGLEKNSLRFIMSLRATGEGHISSIIFREGVIDTNLDIHLRKTSGYLGLPRKIKLKRNDKLDIRLKNSEISDLLDSNYSINFPAGSLLSERILFPSSKSESMGMEDARFVRFAERNNFTYYGTYTAYNGRKFRTQLIKTNDFQSFEIGMLSGNSIKDKGMALFPRKIDDKYVITSRQDSENILIMYSDDIYNWDDAEVIKTPEQPWEFVQLGNCGSPIETSEGWILLTHSVGPMRKYVISALLLDLDDPSKVIGKLKEPLIQPDENERDGYVPNVVYSCGSVVHRNNMIIPYAFSDSGCGFAKIKISELLKMLRW